MICTIGSVNSWLTLQRNTTIKFVKNSFETFIQWQLNCDFFPHLAKIILVCQKCKISFGALSNCDYFILQQQYWTFVKLSSYCSSNIAITKVCSLNQFAYFLYPFVHWFLAIFFIYTHLVIALPTIAIAIVLLFFFSKAISISFP